MVEFSNRLVTSKQSHPSLSQNVSLLYVSQEVREEGGFWHSVDKQALASRYAPLAMGNVIFLEKANLKLYKTSTFGRSLT